MTEKEYILIKCIVDEEIKNNNIDSLKEIRAYITEQIKAYEKRTEPENYDILIYDIREFFDEYIGNNNKFRRGAVYRAVRKMLKRDIEEIITVAEILGIGTSTLGKEDGVGTSTITILETTLNGLGYSLDQELTKEQLSIARRKNIERYGIQKILQKEDTI